MIDQPRFAAGELSTNYIADEFPDGFRGLAATPWQLDVITAAAAAMHRDRGGARPQRSARRPPRRPTHRVGGGRSASNAERIEVADRGRCRPMIDLVDEGRTLALDADRLAAGRAAASEAVLDGRPFTVDGAAAP